MKDIEEALLGCLVTESDVNRADTKEKREKLRLPEKAQESLRILVKRCDEVLPKIALQLVTTVLQVVLDVERELVAVALEQIVVEIEQLGGVLTTDVRWQ